MKKIVGVRHVKGDYQGVAYDNYNVYAVDDNTPDCFGTCPEVLKMKTEVLHQVCNPDKIKNLIGHSIEAYYNAYKKIVKVDIE